MKNCALNKYNSFLFDLLEKIIIEVLSLRTCFEKNIPFSSRLFVIEDLILKIMDLLSLGGKLPLSRSSRQAEV